MNAFANTFWAMRYEYATHSWTYNVPPCQELHHTDIETERSSGWLPWSHYSDVIRCTIASQITSASFVYLTVCSCSDQRKHQSSASLAFVKRIHRWPVNSPHKGPVTRKMFSFDDVIMFTGESLNVPSDDQGRPPDDLSVSMNAVRISICSLGQYGAHLGPVGPRWAPCWPHEPSYQGFTPWIMYMSGCDLIRLDFTHLRFALAHTSGATLMDMDR